MVWFPHGAKALYQAEPRGDSDFQEHFGLSLITYWKPFFCSNASVMSSQPLKMRWHLQLGLINLAIITIIVVTEECTI